MAITGADQLEGWEVKLGYRDNPDGERWFLTGEVKQWAGRERITIMIPRYYKSGDAQYRSLLNGGGIVLAGDARSPDYDKELRALRQQTSWSDEAERDRIKLLRTITNPN